MKRYLLPYASLFLAIVLLSPAGAYAQNKPSRTPPSLPPPTHNVYDTMEAQKSLSKFVEMVDDAGLKSLFTGGSDQPVTVLAPNNEAMDALSSEQEKRIKSSKANLQSFVKYHVITGSLMSSSAFKGRKTSPATDSGEIVTLDGTNRSEAPKVGDGKLVQGDVNATNGVIHIVSTVLLPPSLGGGSNMVVLKTPEPPTPPAPPVVAKPSTVAASGKSSATPLHNVTTAGTPESSPPPSASGATPIDQTATGMPSSQTTTGAIPEVTPEQPAQQPVPAPATGGDDSGSTSIWKKMGW